MTFYSVTKSLFPSLIIISRKVKSTEIFSQFRSHCLPKSKKWLFSYMGEGEAVAVAREKEVLQSGLSDL